MLAIELITGLANVPKRPIYALFGDDSFLKAESRRAILRALLDGDDDGPAVSRVVGAQVELADVLDDVRTLPFLSPSRVVVVEGADSFVTAHRRELEAYTEHPSGTGVLLLDVTAWTSTTRLARQVERVGLAVDCKAPAERELPRVLKSLAESRHQAKLTDEAVRLLLELVGPELGVLASELEKLGTAVASTGVIESADIARNVRAGRIETIWKVLDAATLGDGAQAITLLDRLIDSGEHPVGLLAAMTANLRKLHHAGELRKARVSSAEAMRLAGIPNFKDAVDKTLKQHTHLGPTRVGQLPNILLQADLALKGNSALPPRVVLERLLLLLAQHRRD
jgi:DNA polymerase-3 subunit delta